jgi:CTP synthase (UTP-ammonia lyase)
MRSVRVAIVGDFDRRKHSHWATEAALFHAAARLGFGVEPHWVATTTVASDAGVQQLGAFDAVWGAPGSPYVSMPGILNAIRYARQNDRPYLGTCAGFQYAVIELSRHVLGVADADSAENGGSSQNIVITPVYCESAPAPGMPRLAGPGTARPVPGTRLAQLCGEGELHEEYFCSFEVNQAFVPRWEEVGLVVSARGVDGELRAFELRSHRFFMAALFQPQLSSSYEKPHPIIAGFLRSAAASAQ